VPIFRIKTKIHFIVHHFFHVFSFKVSVEDAYEKIE